MQMYLSVGECPVKYASQQLSAEPNVPKSSQLAESRIDSDNESPLFINLVYIIFIIITLYLLLLLLLGIIISK